MIPVTAAAYALVRAVRKPERVRARKTRSHDCERCTRECAMPLSSPMRSISALIMGQAILPVGMALRATKGENLAFPGRSTKPRKAGQGASRGPGGPPYFDFVVPSRSRLKAGCSQDWLPHNLRRVRAPRQIG